MVWLIFWQSPLFPPLPFLCVGHLCSSESLFVLIKGWSHCFSKCININELIRQWFTKLVSSPILRITIISFLFFVPFIQSLILDWQQQLLQRRPQFKQNRKAKHTGVFVNQLEPINSNQIVQVQIQARCRNSTSVCSSSRGKEVTHRRSQAKVSPWHCSHWSRPLFSKNYSTFTDSVSETWSCYVVSGYNKEGLNAKINIRISARY